jgi:FKBP-type peptidyl-prolyl cis-trans isomerase FklB
MFKKTFSALIFSLAGTLLCGISWAQQSSAPSSNPPATSATTPAAPKAQSTPATTTGAGATAVKKAPAPLVLKTPKDKASYAIGMNIGKGLKDNLKKSDVDVNPDILVRGLKDGLAGNKQLLTDQESKATLDALQKDVQKHQKELHDATIARNLKEGEAYLAANKEKPGVITLPSGLQYKIIQEGTGPKPTASDVVVCNYRGTLIDGTEFDSSTKRGQPATFPVGKVIPGWTEALQLMPVGSKWELVIPPSLGYGERDQGPIGPNSTLIFEIELLSIQPKPEPKLSPVAPPQPTAPPQPQTAPTPQAQPQAQPPQTQPPAQPQAPPQAKPQ